MAPQPRTQVGKVAIIGAGISGLTLAYELQSRGIGFKLFEKSNRVGGVINTVRQGDFIMESGPNTLLLSDAGSDLIHALKLELELLLPEESCKRRFLLRQIEGDLSLVPAPPRGLAEIVSTKLISTSAKLRLLLEPIVTKTPGFDTDVYNFFRRRLGREITEEVVSAAMTGIWAADIKKLSIRSALPKLWKLEQESGSLIRGWLKVRRNRRKHLLPVTFNAGLSELTQRLSQALAPESISLKTEVDRIQRVDQRWICDFSQTDSESEHGRLKTTSEEFDCVVLTAPAAPCSKLLAPHFPEFAERIKEIPYAPIGMVQLAVPKTEVRVDVQGFGFLAAPTTCKAIRGAIFPSVIFPSRAPSDKYLMTCFCGGAVRPEFANVENSEVLGIALQEMKQILGLRFDPEVLLREYWPQAIPNYPVGHFQLQAFIDEIHAGNSGLKILANWHRGISLSDRIEQARQIAIMLAE